MLGIERIRKRPKCAQHKRHRLTFPHQECDTSILSCSKSRYPRLYLICGLTRCHLPAAQASVEKKANEAETTPPGLHVRGSPPPAGWARLIVCRQASPTIFGPGIVDMGSRRWLCPRKRPVSYNPSFSTVLSKCCSGRYGCSAANCGVRYHRFVSRHGLSIDCLRGIYLSRID